MDHVRISGTVNLGIFAFFRVFVYFAKITPTRKYNPYALMKIKGVVS